MNATEQRQRFTAVRTVELQLEDLSTTTAECLEKLDERQRLLTKAGLAVEQCQVDLARILVAVDGRQVAFESMTFWPRLRWLLRGRD